MWKLKSRDCWSRSEPGFSASSTSPNNSLVRVSHGRQRTRMRARKESATRVAISGWPPHKIYSRFPRKFRVGLKIHVLRLCSVKGCPEPQGENRLICIARTRCWKRKSLCFQFTVDFPSWTSRVRVPSPAPKSITYKPRPKSSTSINLVCLAPG
jgi:hypothetical protein